MRSQESHDAWCLAESRFKQRVQGSRRARWRLRTRAGWLRTQWKPWVDVVELRLWKVIKSWTRASWLRTQWWWGEVKGGRWCGFGCHQGGVFLIIVDLSHGGPKVLTFALNLACVALSIALNLVHVAKLFMLLGWEHKPWPHLCSLFVRVAIVRVAISIIFAFILSRFFCEDASRWRRFWARAHERTDAEQYRARCCCQAIWRCLAFLSGI